MSEIRSQATPARDELHPTPFVHVDVASDDLPDLLASARVFPAPRGNVIVYHPSVGVISKNGVSTGRSL